MSNFPLVFIIITMIFHGICSQMVNTKPPTTLAPIIANCPSIDEIKSTMETLFEAQTKLLLSKLAIMQEKLDDMTSCRAMGPSELFEGIYENLSIFPDWLLVYNKPYSHNTTSEELKDAARKCFSNRVVVGAINNEQATMINIAAVGPKRVLSLDATMYEPEEIGNVLWHLKSGVSFGFRPIDNQEELKSEHFLIWALDLSYGGYRAGKFSNLYQDSKWHKVIYCMPTCQSN